MDFLKNENVRHIMAIMDDVLYVYKALLARSEGKSSTGTITDEGAKSGI